MAIPNMSSSSVSTPKARRPSGGAAAQANDSPRLGSSIQMSPSSSSAGNGASKPLVSPSLLFTSILIPFCLLLVQRGLVNVLLVVTCSALLLVNPWVRIFLELPQADQGDEDAQYAEYPGSGASSPQAGSPLLHGNRIRGLGAPPMQPPPSAGRRGAHLSRFDPARYLAVSEPKEEKRAGEDEEGRKKVRPRALRATRMSESLRRPLDELTELAVRDFVRSWYDQQTLRHQSFPRTAHFTIDEIVDSVHGRIVTSGMRSVDLASELVLTTSSVLLSALRSRRRAPTDPASLYRKSLPLDPATDPRNPFSGPAAGQSPLWPNTAARIDSLRMAVGALLDRHMPREENASRLVIDLVRELLVKHLWTLICGVGEPDFLNRKIVEWGDKQAGDPSFGPADSPATAPVPVEIDPLLLGQARKEAASTAAESLPASLAPASPSAMPPSDGTITSQPRAMSMQPSPAPSMTLTTQPRAMAMPSPGPRTSSDVETHLSSPTSSRSAAFPSSSSSRLDSGLPDSRSISPAVPAAASSGHASPAPSSRPSTGSRSLPRSSVDAPPQQQLTREPLATLGGFGSFASGAVGSVAGGVGAVAGGVAKGMSKGVDLVGEALDEVGEAIVGNGERGGPTANTPAMRGPPTMQPSAIPASRTYAGQPMMTPSAMPRTGYRSASAASTPSSSYDHSVPYGGLSPRNKPQRRLAEERDDDIDRVMGAGFAVPFDVPPEVHQSVQLPESLRASLREPAEGESSTTQAAHQAADSEPSRSGDGAEADDDEGTAPAPPRKSLDGYSISEAPQTEAEPVPVPVPGPAPSSSGPPLPPRPQPSAPAEASQFAQPRPASASSTPVRQRQPSSSSISSGAPPLAHVLTRTDSDAILSIRDAFEAWLERGGSSGSVSSARVAPEEGEALLRLHIGLATIARLVPTDSEETEPFRPDALSILVKARDALDDIEYERAGADPVVRDALRQAVHNLERGPGAGGIRSIVGPVEKQLWSRLLGLYQVFWKEQQAYKRQSEDAKAGGALSYEPRRRPTATTTPAAAAARTSSSSRPGSSGMGANSQAGSLPPAGAFSNAGEDDSAGSALSNIEITVTDVSANAERLNANVDPRTLELMIAVEGLAAEGGGFVLMRSWADFEVLDRDLRQAASGPAPTAPLPPLPLPNARRMSSIVLSQALERYLLGILSSPAHVATSAVAHFVDKARAGAASGARSNALLQSLNRGLNVGAKNFASGVEAMGKTAISTLQRPIATAAAAGAGAMASPQRGKPAPQSGGITLTSEPTSMTANDLSAGPASRSSPEKRSASRLEPPSERGPPRRSPSEDEVAIEELRAMTAKTRATAERAQSDKSPPPSAKLSQRDLSAILSAVFAIADEAFSLSGGWTLRRGMLRVLEQIVRTQYSSSVLSAFNGVAESLSTDQFGKWATETRERWWPNGHFVGNEPGEERTPEMKRKTAIRAREIVLGYAPAQAGYVLGPGGRQACEKAISAVHDEVTDPLTSLDLGLMLTLRLLEIATR